MGLAVSVGSLAFALVHDSDAVEWLRQDFEEVNRVLTANNLPPHTEPESLPEINDRAGVGSMPYSWLHYLRRAVAYARQAPDQFAPVPEGENPAQDERVDRELSVFMDSHVICHSDCEGYYLPIDFPEPLYDDRDRITGGILGSSQQALRELVQVVPLLRITLRKNRLSDRLARDISKELEKGQPYWIERQAWLCLFERLRQSIEFGSAVVFG